MSEEFSQPNDSVFEQLEIAEQRRRNRTAYVAILYVVIAVGVTGALTYGAQQRLGNIQQEYGNVQLQLSDAVAMAKKRREEAKVLEVEAIKTKSEVEGLRREVLQLSLKRDSLAEFVASGEASDVDAGSHALVSAGATSYATQLNEASTPKDVGTWCYLGDYDVSSNTWRSSTIEIQSGVPEKGRSYTLIRDVNKRKRKSDGSLDWRNAGTWRKGTKVKILDYKIEKYERVFGRAEERS